MTIRRQRRNLTKDKILTSATALVESDGVDALTMRKLAADLGIEAMSLYNHFRNKGELLEAIAEKAVGDIDLPEPCGDWRADIRGYAAAFRVAALASPGVTAMILSRQLFTINILRITEKLLRALQDGGLNIRDSVFAARLLLIHLAGTLTRELRTDSPTDPATLSERQQFLEGSGFPAVAAAAPYLAKPSGEDEFLFGIELVIFAFEERLMKPSQERWAK